METLEDQQPKDSVGAPAGEVPAWYSLDASEACRRLSVEPRQGLSREEAIGRLRRFGPNKLLEKPPRSPWALFIQQFRSLLILVLLAAAVLAGAIGDLKDAIVILGVVFVNAALGFYQEYRAEKSLEALKKMLADTCRVRRDGQVIDVPADELVPGDIVDFEAGDRVPADGRLIEVHSVEIDEAPITGESYPVSKSVKPVPERDVPLADRVNTVFMNTTATRGRGEFVVTATGMNTCMGHLAGMLETAELGPTPLQLQLDGLGRRLALIAAVVIAIILTWGLLRGEPLVQTILTAIALAVAAIPEGLPAVVTVTLALGMYHMARRGAIVRRLAAVETLGCTTVICSDKTGTLTMNQMTVRALFYRGRRFSVTGAGYEPVGEIAPEGNGDPLPDMTPLMLTAALCNDSRLRDSKPVGDPMEAALLALAAKAGLDREAQDARLPRIAEIPFDAAHKFMATFHHDGDRVRLFVKGAPDVLLSVCNRRLGPDGDEALDRDTVTEEVEALAARALRVLAFASRTLPAAEFDPSADLFSYVDDLTSVGLVGLMDPPRPEARDAIRLCRQAGIMVKMITGDHRVTAAAIARELGIEGEVITGIELAEMDDARLSEAIEAIGVFARVAPEHKVRIVRALKQRSHVVAMTGDGVNDAPAIKNADIGVAMGITGTDVTKEAATMVLTDDNFATIVGAVERGRTIYDNILKFVRFQLSTNVGAVLTVLIAPFLGLPVPFSPIQILWVNIIMDGPPAMALGLDPGRPDIMSEPPRVPGARILTLRRLVRLVFYGTIMMVGTLAVLHYALQTGTAERAFALTFTTFVLFQVFNVFNARVETGSTFMQGFFRNGKLWLALLGVVALQLVIVEWPPAHEVFHTAHLSLADWALAVGVASSVLIIEEFRKFTTMSLRRL